MDKGPGCSYETKHTTCAPLIILCMCRPRMNDDLSFFLPFSLHFAVIIIHQSYIPVLASTAEFQEERVIWRALNVEKARAY